MTTRFTVQTFANGHATVRPSDGGAILNAPAGGSVADNFHGHAEALAAARQFLKGQPATVEVEISGKVVS